jgi:hypothetical protein
MVSLGTLSNAASYAFNKIRIQIFENTDAKGVKSIVIWGSHGGDYEEYHLMGRDAV